MQIRDAAGVKGRRGPTPSAAGLHRPRSRNDGTNLELRSSETWGECDSIILHIELFSQTNIVALVHYTAFVKIHIVTIVSI